MQVSSAIRHWLTYSKKRTSQAIVNNCSSCQLFSRKLLFFFFFFLVVGLFGAFIHFRLAVSKRKFFSWKFIMTHFDLVKRPNCWKFWKCELRTNCHLWSQNAIPLDEGYIWSISNLTPCTFEFTGTDRNDQGCWSFPLMASLLKRSFFFFLENWGQNAKNEHRVSCETGGCLLVWVWKLGVAGTNLGNSLFAKANGLSKWLFPSVDCAPESSLVL